MRPNSRLAACIWIAFAVLVLPGCTHPSTDSGWGGGSGGGGFDAASASPGGGHPGGELGATPGGAQDLRHARSLIASGMVPPPDTITVEGLLSEHDLPTEGEPCEDLMCARPAVARAPSLETGEDAWWLHLGMTSGLPTDFVRPPLDVAVVIDRSGAMSVDMAETNEAVARLIAQLRQDDRLAVIAFNDVVETVHSFGPVHDSAALIDDVRALDARGGADLMAGMSEGYEVLRAAGDDPSRLRRVVVLSCGYPSAGVSHESSFEALVQAGGEERIGLSFVGVLLDYNYELAEMLSRARGGASYYTDTLEAIEEVFDTDFDFMVSPIAYDLAFGVELSDGFAVDRVFGIPGDATGEPRTELEVSTAFLSRRRGGIVLRLIETSVRSQELGTVQLAYTPESAHGWSEPVASETTVTWDDTTADIAYGSDGVRKAVALVNQAERMRAACAAYHAGDVGGAGVIVDELHAYLSAEAEALDDDALRDEVALVDALAALL